MFTFIVVIHIIVSFVMIIAVLLQVGKGASIGSTFGGGSSSQTVFGSAGPATMLGKVTYACAAIFMITSLTLTYLSSRQKSTSIMSGVPSVTTTAPPAVPAAPGAPGMPETK